MFVTSEFWLLPIFAMLLAQDSRFFEKAGKVNRVRLRFNTRVRYCRAREVQKLRPDGSIGTDFS